MKKLVILLALLVMISPAFAASMNVSGTNMAASYINTKTPTNMINLTLYRNSTDDVTVTGINITMGGNATINNVSGVFLYYSNGTSISSTLDIASSTFVVGTSILISGNINVLIAFNVSGTANLASTVNASIASGAIASSAGTNVSFVNLPNSTSSEIRDVHANAAIAPNYVDTNTINQTLVLTITPTGRTPINKTVITIPAGYSFVNVSTVQYNGVNSTSDLSITTSPNYINITANTPSNATLNPIKVWFNVNTSVAYASGLFTPAIWGEGINGISGDVVSVNVTTQQLVNNVTITPTKMAAIVNGVDYWEFNFTLNITANATGLLQFKMSNWTDTSGNRMNISDGTTAYATLRNTSDFATTNKININSSYVDGVGITKVATQNELFTVILRMIIPSGTPISNSWMTTYGILFRAIPA